MQSISSIIFIYITNSNITFYDWNNIEYLILLLWRLMNKHKCNKRCVTRNYFPNSVTFCESYLLVQAFLCNENQMETSTFCLSSFHIQQQTVHDSYHYEIISAKLWSKLPLPVINKSRKVQHCVESHLNRQKDAYESLYMIYYYGLTFRM